jgi:hypothetical protein
VIVDVIVVVIVVEAVGANVGAVVVVVVEVTVVVVVAVAVGLVVVLGSVVSGGEVGKIGKSGGHAKPWLKIQNDVNKISKTFMLF